uniref:Uncharacterized protein n=1 Tax=Parascaris univalens TaxID=6257 RepID=A0A915AVW0_PARUN
KLHSTLASKVQQFHLIHTRVHRLVQSTIIISFRSKESSLSVMIDASLFTAANCTKTNIRSENVIATSTRKHSTSESKNVALKLKRNCRKTNSESSSFKLTITLYC